MKQKIITQAKKIALLAVKEAGHELSKLYQRPGRINVGLKSKHQIVTIADKLAEKLIISRIRKNFYNHSILSEEIGAINKGKDYLWIIDPLDGTTNFVMKNPIFSTTLALVYKQQVVLGVIYAPILNELYVTVLGQGAYYNQKKIKVSNVKIIKNGFHTYCYGSSNEKFPQQAINYYQTMFRQGNEIRQLGAATLEFARVARGVTESIIIPGANAWDVAAGALLVREAGGKVTDFKNKTWRLSSSDIIATNGLVHTSLLRIINGQKK
jgi:myo-inositol-1(or 4)-monophosphatase